eukprot:scaffold31773_cov62-Attheya_sp.AAC.2
MEQTGQHSDFYIALSEKLIDNTFDRVGGVAGRRSSAQEPGGSPSLFHKATGNPRAELVRRMGAHGHTETSISYEPYGGGSGGTRAPQSPLVDESNGWFKPIDIGCDYLKPLEGRHKNSGRDITRWRAGRLRLLRLFAPNRRLIQDDNAEEETPPKEERGEDKASTYGLAVDNWHELITPIKLALEVTTNICAGCQVCAVETFESHIGEDDDDIMWGSDDEAQGFPHLIISIAVIGGQYFGGGAWVDSRNTR